MRSKQVLTRVRAGLIDGEAMVHITSDGVDMKLPAVDALQLGKLIMQVAHEAEVFRNEKSTEPKTAMRLQ